MDKDSRNKLIEAATSLFAAKGYAAVSIRELAAEAGVNVSLITYHFGGKEGLYSAILESQFEPFINGFQEVKLKKLAPEKRLVEFCKYFMEIHIRFPFFRQFLNSEILHPSPCFQTIVQKYSRMLFQFVYETIQEGIAAEVFRDDLDPGFIIVAILGMINYYFIAQEPIRMVVPLKKDSDAEYVHQLLKILFEGIQRGK